MILSGGNLSGGGLLSGGLLSGRRRQAYLNWLLTLPGLVALWPLDDAVGSATARDAKGGYTGTVSGGVTFGVPGVAGYTAAAFDGTSGLISCGTGLDFSAGTFSVFAWIKPSSTSGFRGIIGKRTGANYQWQWRISSGSLNILTTSAVATTLAVPTDSPSLATVTRSSAGGAAYLNATAQAITIPAPSASHATDPLNIGGAPGVTNWFAGSLGIVGACNLALDAATIAEIYNRGIA